MPQVPVFDTSLNIPTPAGPPRADPNLVAAPGAALAQGGAQVASEALTWEDRYSEARRQSDAANIAAQGYDQLGDAYFRASKIPDHQQALAQFDSDAGGIQKAIGGQSSDPLVQSYVQRALSAHAAALRPSVQEQSFGLESSARRGDLDLRLDNYARLAATAPNDLARAQIAGQAQADIAGTQAGGWIHPEEADRMQLLFNSRAAEVKVRQDMLTDPSGTAARLLDPATAQRAYPGLLPEASEMLAMRANNRALRMETRAAAGQAHADAMVERNLRQRQATNETNVLAAIYSGQTVDMNAVADAARNGLVSPGGLDTIHTALIQGREGNNDPQAVLEMYRRLGNGTLTNDDIHAAVQAQAIKASTAFQMQTTLNAGANAVDKANFATLMKSIAGDDNGKSSFLKFGDGAAQDQQDREVRAALAVNAELEWGRRVLGAGGGRREDSTAVLYDMLPRYWKTPVSIAALPRPRLGVVTDETSLNDVAVRTLAARDGGQMDEATYQREVTLLNALRTALPPPPPPPPPKQPTHVFAPGGVFTGMGSDPSSGDPTDE